MVQWAKHLLQKNKTWFCFINTHTKTSGHCGPFIMPELGKEVQGTLRASWLALLPQLVSSGLK